MALNVRPVNETSSAHAPLILLYAMQGLGKTTLGLSAPNAIYAPITPEEAPRGINAVGFDPATTFIGLIDNLRALFKESHAYTSVVIDSLDALEPLVYAETCRRNGWANIESPGYGKGHFAADTVWRELIAACDALRRRRGIMVIWTALAEVDRHEEPGQPPYAKYSLRLHKRGEGLTTQAADAVLFINTKVTIKTVDTGFGKKEAYADGGGVRWAYCDGRPAFIAKNRFDMPDSIMLPKEAPWSALAPFLPAPVEPEPVSHIEMLPPAVPVDLQLVPSLMMVVPPDKPLHVNPPSSQAEMEKDIKDDLGALA